MPRYHVMDAALPLEDEEVFDVIIGRTVGPKTAAALGHGQTMTSERYQEEVVLRFRRGEPVIVADRTPNKAELLQRANEVFRKKTWGQN